MPNNPILDDPIYAAMTTVLATERHNENFSDLLRSFWTTVCTLNGVSPEQNPQHYDEALDRLCTVYAKAGVTIDRADIGKYLDGDLSTEFERELEQLKPTN